MGVLLVNIYTIQSLSNMDRLICAKFLFIEAPVLVLANKQDLPDAMSVREARETPSELGSPKMVGAKKQA